MIYLQLSLLALGAILLNYDLMISMLCIVIFLLITWKNKNLNARKTIICLIVFLAFFIRGAYEQKNNISHLNNVENKNLELVISGKFPSLSLRKKNNRQKTRNTKVKSLLFFIFVLL